LFSLPDPQAQRGKFMRSTAPTIGVVIL